VAAQVANFVAQLLGGAGMGGAAPPPAPAPATAPWSFAGAAHAAAFPQAQHSAPKEPTGARANRVAFTAVAIAETNDRDLGGMTVARTKENVRMRFLVVLAAP